MKALLIGSGGREHAIAEALVKSSYHSELFVFAKTKNPGISSMAQSYEVAHLIAFDALASFVKKTKPDFAIVGPEDPIAEGVADLLAEYDVRCVAPFKKVAVLESSKSFTRMLLTKYGIPGNPRYKVFYAEEGMEEFIAHNLGGEFVIKADGLKGGKGVKVAGDHLSSVEEGLLYAKECLQDSGKVVIEEKLVGEEFSLMSFCDGRHIVTMPPVQDHKRAFEGDRGPNTGGMGSYSCSDHLLPFLSHNDISTAHVINDCVREALFKETGMAYKGIMYGGFMRTCDGIRVVEYNVRFGDPECMNILPLLKTDFVEVCLAILEGSLEQLHIQFENKSTICTYVVPEGYPDKETTVGKIEIGNIPEGVRLYFASVDQRDDGLYLTSSRALAFVGIDDTLEKAQQRVQKALSRVKGPIYYRSDIGSPELIRKKAERMKKITQSSA